jgi:hypothetical protein
MPLHIYHSRRYLDGPKKGKVFRVKVFVGPYASMVLEAQQRRGNKPIRLRGTNWEDYNFRLTP